MMPLLVASAEDWDRVRAVPAGTAVKVRTFEGVESKGALEAVNDAALQVKHGGQTVSVARSEIGRVSVYDEGRRARNALIGGAIGVGAGILAAFVSCPTCRGELPGGEANERLAVGAVVGGAAGAGIGAAMTPYKTVYKAKRARR